LPEPQPYTTDLDFPLQNLVLYGFGKLSYMFITCLGSQFEENAFLFCTAADSSIKGCYKLVATLMSNYYCAMQKTKQ